MQRHDLDADQEPETFMIDYPFDGGIRTAYITAIDWDDALAQLSALQAFGHIEGRLIEAGEVASVAIN